MRNGADFPLLRHQRSKRLRPHSSFTPEERATIGEGRIVPSEHLDSR